MRRNFREVRDRFTHIDAEFVACSLGFPEDRPFYRVRLYPWWEHPKLQEAVATDAPWGFTDYSDGMREVTVHPIDLVSFRISRAVEVTDWSFEETGPHVWDYEPDGQIFLNGDIDRDELVSEVQQRLDVDRLTVRRMIAAPDDAAWAPPFSLRLPRSVLLAAMAALDERHVAYHPAYVPPPPDDLPIAFVIDGTDVIIARDFEIDVPDFDHRPEWFQPPVAE